MRSRIPGTLLLIVLLVTACDQSSENEQQTLVPAPSSTPTLTYTVTPTHTILNTSTLTPEPCNPSEDGFCIVDGTFIFQRPIIQPGMDTVDRSYPYGSTAKDTRSPHHGVEFYNASGTPVLAVADGVVVFAGDDSTTLFCSMPGYYGNLVVLEHDMEDQSIYTLYAHLSRIDVSAQQTIGAGDKIAEVGSSGAAIGSHLHFEVRLAPQDAATTLNPELWLIPLPETGVLSMRFTDGTGQLTDVQTSVQYFPDPASTFTQAWQPEPYALEIAQQNSWENILLGNIPAGTYRITYFWEGIFHERWVEIQSGKLTMTQIELP